MRVPKKLYAVISPKTKGPVEEGDMYPTLAGAKEAQKDRNDYEPSHDEDWQQDWRIVTYVREDLV